MTVPPAPRDTPRASARFHLRFEDITQTGKLVLEAVPLALAPTVWRGLLKDDPAAAALFAQGIVPILSRFVIEGHGGPFSANGAMEAEGTCRLVRTDDGRFMLDMWADLHGHIGRTYGATEHDGERALAGRVLAEHVLTRPFAPPDKRRVRDLDFPGAPPVLGTRPAPPPYEELLRVPEGATALDAERVVDAVPIVFGIVHTDSNMHVNSLAYMRVFEEAALRRFATLGRGGGGLLGRTIDIAYRKPCFAGQVMRVVSQVFEKDARLGMVAALVEEADTSSPEKLALAKPHTYVSMTFEG